MSAVVQATEPDAAKRPLSSLLRVVPQSVWPVVVFVLLFLLGGLIRPTLLSVDSLIGTATFAMILAVASFGQTFAVIQGAIDLSVPNTISFAGLSFLTWSGRIGPVAGFLAAILSGVVIGVLNGLIVTKLRLTPIVTTIAMNGLLFGVVLLSFKNSELTQIPAFITAMTADKIQILGVGVPAVLLLGLVLLVVLQLVLGYTGWGRSLFVVGAAADTARLGGLPVDRIRIAGFAVSGALAALAGTVVVGFYGQALANMGDPYLLGSVAAVVVGGASIFGGRGSVVGTFGGALVLGQVATLVDVANLGANIQQLIYGAIVLVVVALYGRRSAA